MIGWLIRHSLPYQLLERELAAERESHATTRSERDDYRRLYVDKVEYIAVARHEPRFSTINQAESKPPFNAKLSRAEIEAIHQRDADHDFAEWLLAHPEERVKLSGAPEFNE